MKHIILTVLLLAATSVAAQEPQKIVQHLDLNPDKELMIIVTGDYTTVNIYQDTVDYVSILTPDLIDTVHITQPLFRLEKEDYSPHLFVGGYGAYTFFEIHIRTEKLYLYNRFYNRVSILSAKGYGRHKLKYKELSIQTDDYSLVEITSPVEAENIIMIAEKNSLIRYDSYTAEEYSENTKENAIIYGGMRNGESLAPKHHVLDYKTEGYKPFEPKRLRYRPAQRIHLRLSSAFLNGGLTALSGLGWKEDQYVEDHVTYPAMKTTLGSHQVELGYDIVCRRHFAIGVGVGYSYSHYRFKDPYVGYIFTGYDGHNWIDNAYLTPREPQYGGGDSLQYWSTHLTTHYITFPITLTYYADSKHHKGFHLSVAVVPGFGLGQGKLNSRYCQWEEDAERNLLTGRVINDQHINYGGKIGLLSTFDYRITVGWSRWSVMVQLPDPSGFSFSLAARSMIPFYPFRLGVMLDL